MSVVLGTSGVVFAALPAFAADPQARVHAFCHAVPGGWHAMGVMLSAGGSLRWLRDTLGRRSGYDELDRGGRRLAAGRRGADIPPVPRGRAHAARGPGGAGAFAGLTLRHDRGALVRAVLEGVAYGLRDSLELLRELGVDATVGRASGGGARSELWLRIVASVLDLPLERTRGRGGLGLRCGAVRRRGRGRLSRTCTRRWPRCVRVRDAIEPDPAWQPAYEDGCGAFDRSIQRFDHWRPDELHESRSAGGFSPRPTSTGNVLAGAARVGRSRDRRRGEPRPAARRDLRARVGDRPRATASYEALLADDDVEAVYISLPNSLHCEWSVRALEAGKHVLCEKPMGRHAAEVELRSTRPSGAGGSSTEAFM